MGYITDIRESFKRMRHNAYTVTGILQAYTCQGIGTKLFKELENWATYNKINRLELTVMCHNQAGLALYKKMGF